MDGDGHITVENGLIGNIKSVFLKVQFSVAGLPVPNADSASWKK